jgi:hypothetical protein
VIADPLSARSIMRSRLLPEFGPMQLDQISSAT